MLQTNKHAAAWKVPYVAKVWVGTRAAAWSDTPIADQAKPTVTADAQTADLSLVTRTTDQGAECKQTRQLIHSFMLILHCVFVQVCALRWSRRVA
jgi:hypothetical protein